MIKIDVHLRKLSHNLNKGITFYGPLCRLTCSTAFYCSLLFVRCTTS